MSSFPVSNFSRAVVVEWAGFPLLLSSLSPSGHHCALEHGLEGRHQWAPLLSSCRLNQWMGNTWRKSRPGAHPARPFSVGSTDQVQPHGTERLQIRLLPGAAGLSPTVHLDLKEVECPPFLALECFPDPLLVSLNPAHTFAELIH